MIRVLFFASLREAVGAPECEIPLVAPDGRAFGLEGLLAELRRRLEAGAYAALMAENVRIAVNRELVDREAAEGSVALRSGDEVAFLPPVTGG